MGRTRMGQVLEQMGKLSGHDIDEILQEQSSSGSRRPFGEIALGMGLCEPEDLWHAWVTQLSPGSFERVNLSSLGVDAQAVSRMTRETASRFGAMPVRLVGGKIVIALSDAAHAPVFEAMGESLGAKPHFVLADGEQVREMIARYYPAGSAAA